MKFLPFLLFVFFSCNQIFSCSTFVLDNEETLVFGRNLDWVSDKGVVVVNKRGIDKYAVVFPPNKAATWTSTYGSVSFNQFGKELPFGGINEAGLVVEIMLAPGEYPEQDERLAVNELQWIQYQLDNAGSVDEVIASDSEIRITKIQQNIHFLVCDRTGNRAVIEFDRKGMNVFKGDDLPISALENDDYPTSLHKFKSGESCRFTTMANMISQYDNTTSPIDYSFDILSKVALEGSWGVVYDIKNMEIYFRTESDENIRHIKFNEFDFSNESVSLLYDMQNRGKGNVTNNFLPFTQKLNKKKLNAAIKSNGIRLPGPALELFYNLNPDTEQSTSKKKVMKSQLPHISIYGIVAGVALFIVFGFFVLRKRKKKIV